MLAEGVVGEQDLVVLVVGDHGIGPVHHGRLYESERALSDLEGVAGLHAHEVKTVPVMSAKSLDALGRTGDDSGFRSDFGQSRKASGMIHLHMVGHNIVDGGRIHDGADAFDELAGEGLLAGVDERDLLVEDEVGVVGASALGGVAVEVALVPIDAAHPEHVGLDLDGLQHIALLVSRLTFAS